MSLVASYTKSANGVLDYQISWSTWLDGDAIATSDWTVPSGITEDSDSNTTTTATIWVSGGTDGEAYTLVNQIVTAGGRTAERSIEIIISEYNVDSGYYADVSDVNDRIPQYGGFRVNGATKPNITQVGEFIQAATGQLNSILRVNYSLPITDTDALAMFRDKVANYAALRSLFVAGLGNTANATEVLGGWRDFLKELREGDYFFDGAEPSKTKSKVVRMKKYGLPDSTA